MKLLTNKQQELYENAEICCICKETFEDKYTKDNKYCKVRDYCHCAGVYRGATHRVCNLKYSVSKEIPLVFQTGSNYNYHFLIKELAEEFKGNV